MTLPDWLRDAIEPSASLVGEAPVPSQFKDARLSEITAKPLHSLLRKYGSEFWQAAAVGVAPLLVGPPGTYKSYAAAVLCKQLHAKVLIRTTWCTVPVQLTKLERMRFTATTDETIETWKSCPFLVCDDFAMVRINSWQHDVLIEIAMARFEAQKPTLWTGNVVLAPGNIQALTDAVGAQLCRRLLERSTGYRLYVQGQSEQPWSSNLKQSGETLSPSDGPRPSAP